MTTTLRHRLAADTRYTLLGLPTAIAHFTVSVTGLAAGLGSAVAFVGLPILSGAATAATTLADHERAALPPVLGHAVTRPHYQPAPAGSGWFRRMINPLTSGQSWTDLLYGIISFPLSLATAVITAAWWLAALVGLTFPLYGWYLMEHIPGMATGGLPALLGLGTGDLAYTIFNTAAGVLFALTLIPLTRAMALTKATLAQIMLTRPAATAPLHLATA